MSDRAWRIWFAWCYAGTLAGTAFAFWLWTWTPVPIAWGVATGIGLWLGYRAEKRERTWWRA